MEGDRVNIYKVRFSSNGLFSDYPNYKQGYEAFNDKNELIAILNFPGHMQIYQREVIAESGKSACFKLCEWKSNGQPESWLTE